MHPNKQSMAPPDDGKAGSDLVTIVEVGPRDGLQNESVLISTENKLALIALLATCGFARVEATAFVSPKWVPQMADHVEVMRRAPRGGGVRLSALVPNEQGAVAAIAAGADEIAVFTSASETFSIRNINCSVDDSLARFIPVLKRASDYNIPVRGYLSCAVDCPYEGPIKPSQVAKVAARLRDLGCGEIALSDTIGTATPDRVSAMIKAVLNESPASLLAGHFHDTAGFALSNVDVAWELGVRVFDSAIGGLGGCPYAPGAAGNLATGALAGHFARRNISTGIDLDRLKLAEQWVADVRGY
jgi:hydroxymethylglutaryl-CoA lyase